MMRLDSNAYSPPGARVLDGVHRGWRLMVLALSARFSLGATASSSGFTHIKSLAGIEEYRLDANGLTVLLAPDHASPVATVNVTYLVGSRHEESGMAGAAHILEHMSFKGSEKFSRTSGNSLSQFLERVGARYNATTTRDRTNYYATLGRAHVEGYLEFEADRMRHLALRKSDLCTEMTVVRNEFERGRNSPLTVLLEEVTAAAYQALSYHHPTIGWKSDIEHIPIEGVRGFYDRYYWPNNAAIIIAGDIELRAALQLIGKYFGAHPRSPNPMPHWYTEEPEQTGPRRVTVKRSSGVGAVIIAHKVPEGRHGDQAALAVLDGILAGGKSARLTRALIDQGLALQIEAHVHIHYGVSLHTITARVAPQASHEAVERALEDEIDRIRTVGVSASEVECAKRQYEAATAFRRDGTAGVAGELSNWFSAGDWTLYGRLAEQVRTITSTDVQRVARTWIDADLSTIGWFVGDREARD